MKSLRDSEGEALLDFLKIAEAGRIELCKQEEHLLTRQRSGVGPGHFGFSDAVYVFEQSELMILNLGQEHPLTGRW